MTKLTYERLHELLDLNYETGLFTRRITKGARFKAGTIATPQDKGDGYKRIGLDWKQYNYARVVWLYVHGHWPEGEIDHINGDPADNRPANLRVATHQQNVQARKRQRKTKSGYRGVTMTPTGKFQAQISVNCRKQHIGVYLTAEEAHAAWRAKAKELRGEFSGLDD
jgi:hypothetical protein